jgi:hypothetical protein
MAKQLFGGIAVASTYLPKWQSAAGPKFEYKPNGSTVSPSMRPKCWRRTHDIIAGDNNVVPNVGFASSDEKSSRASHAFS